MYYDKDKYLKSEIMDQSRHQFIYGYNTSNRSNFLKELESDYPVIMDSNRPVAIYLNTYGLPKKDIVSNDSFLDGIISREYLSFLIVKRIMERTLLLDKSILNSRLIDLIKMINRSRNKNHQELRTIYDFLKELDNTINGYYNGYINGKVDIDAMTIPFIELEHFINKYKECMNMSSYFGVIIDKKDSIAKCSTESINNLIGSRINKDISMKVAVEPNEWESYKDSNGQYIEAVHDYGTVDLDHSYNEYLYKLTRNKNRQ